MVSHTFPKIFEGPIGNAFVQRLTANKNLGAFIIIVIWLALTIVGAIYSEEFSTNGSISMDAPEGTEARDAANMYVDIFNAAGNQLVTLSCMLTTDDITTSPIISTTTQNLAGYFYTFNLDKKTSDDSTKQGYVGDIVTYWVLEAGVGAGAGSMVLNTGVAATSTATLFSASYNADKEDIVKYTDDINEYYEKTLKDSDYDVICLSSSSILEDVAADAEKTLKYMDFISIPIIIVLLIVILKSIPLMILPLMATAASLMASIFVCHCIAEFAEIDYISISSSIMSAFTLALCVDFSLFILTRYKQASSLLGSISNPKEESGKKLIRERGILALRFALSTAGRNVAVSGTACFICVSTMILFPVTAMRNIGIFLAVTMLFTILSNLTLTPALLAAFPRFFQYGLNCQIQRRERGMKTVGERVWNNISKLPLHKYFGPISSLVVLICVVPMLFPLSSISISLSSGQAVPSDSKHLGYLGDIQKYFSGTSIEPIRIMIKNSNGSIWTEEAFNLIQAFVSELPSLEFDGYSPTIANASSHVTLGGNPIPFALASQLKSGAVSGPFAAYAPYIPSYQFLLSRLISSDGQTALVSFTPNVDPYGEVEDFFLDLRDIVDKYNDMNNDAADHWEITHSMYNQIDSVKKTYSMIALIFILIIVIIFGISYEAFKSVIAPLRTIICVALAICFAMGLAEWLREEIFDVKGFFYMSPIVCTILCIALAVDYDTFLSVAIQNELLSNPKLSTSEAIESGLRTSGATITGAGLIMSSAFAILMTSESSLLRQFGFILTVTVLFDVLIVCLFVHPYLMKTMGRLHWWPHGLKMTAALTDSKKDEKTTINESDDEESVIIEQEMENHSDEENSSNEEDSRVETFSDSDEEENDEESFVSVVSDRK